MQKQGLNSPKPLFYGRTEKGDWVLVTEKLSDTRTVIDVLGDMNTTDDKVNLVLLVCKYLAKHHEKGVLQKDLHLGNFIYSGKTLYSIDPAQISFYKKPISKSKSIKQLALLLCCFQTWQKKITANLFNEYMQTRGWQASAKDEKLFVKYFQKWKLSLIKRSLKKCLRTGKSYLRVETNSSRTVFERRFL